MSFKSIMLNGFRGYSRPTVIEFAVPDGIHEGSGLTILVGPNNSGKSTVIEAIHFITASSTRILPAPMRNSTVDLKNNPVILELTDDKDSKYAVKINPYALSDIQRTENGNRCENLLNLNTFVLSNKRGFTATFNAYNESTRENYRSNIGGELYRKEDNYNTLEN